MLKITDRISQVIDIKGITKYKFHKDLGLSNGFLDKSRDIGTDKYANILEYLPDVNSEWLLTGKGEMLKSDIPSPTQEDNSKLIPMIPVEAMAGWGKGDAQVMDYELGHYKIPEFDNIKVDFMIRAKGSSMYPKYNSGDTLACLKVSLGVFFQWNKVYVLDTSQGAMVKRIKKSEKDNHILCVSDNQNYDPFDLPLKELYGIALVVGVIRLE